MTSSLEKWLEKILPRGSSGWFRLGVCLLAIYVLAGVAYSFALGTRLRYQDEGWYTRFSYNLRHGNGFSMAGNKQTAERPPGYPYFVAAIEATGAGIYGVRIVQFFLLAGTIWLSWRFFLPEFKLTGLPLLAMLVAIYPALFYTAGTLYPQTLSAFLFIAALGLALQPSRSWPDMAKSGIFFGLLILVVPTFGPTFLVFLVVSGILRLINWREGFLIFILAAAVVSVWTVRNYVVLHRFVPISTNTGLNLLAGNSDVARYNTGSTNELGHFIWGSSALELDEVDADRKLRDMAIDWIRTHPQRAAILYFEKVLNQFNLWNDYWGSQTGRGKQIVQAASYALLLGLLAWRLVEARRFPLSRIEMLLLALYILTAFTQAIFFTRIRFRLPYDFLIIILIARHLEWRFFSRFESAPSISGNQPHIQ